jgi:CBS domain-containing protein
MKVRDIMRPVAVSLPQSGTLRDVVQVFLQHHLDSLPIIDAALRVVGVITIDHLVDIFLPRYHELLRDLSALEDKGQIVSLFAASSFGLGHPNEKLILAADIMNSHIRWVSQDDTLLQAAARLQAQNAQRLPVIDRDDKLVGILSHADIVLALLRGDAAKVR